MENAAKSRAINRICAGMVLLACVLIGLMLTTVRLQGDYDSDSAHAPAGWVAVVGAALVFGESPTLVTTPKQGHWGMAQATPSWSSPVKRIGDHPNSSG
eukprot:4789501-Pyramimonas_sp.AAC.1